MAWALPRFVRRHDITNNQAMNRSRYVPNPVYSVNPYQQQQQQQYGAIPQQAQLQGMMPGQAMSMHPSAYGSPPPGVGHSPMQTSMSPNTNWAANFANGPIIEDLCAPPPPMGMHASPPMNGMHPRMAMGPMHPGGMPQIQNVYGLRQPTPHPFAPQGMHPGPGQPTTMQGMPSARVMGTYPPYTGQQHGIGIVYPRPMDPNAMMVRPRLETAFANPVPTGPGGNAGLGMGQVASPNMGGSPGGDGMQPLTPVEEALREFLSPDLGDLGDLGRQ
ncbi:hypothetical protein F5144DRAFT_595587 [Chaetomium tenue]|uniref:Uncharacterized protein n=1 Tax=Chaetomium tenue TaxID=1854479 RepID=A0ACB7P1I1_9PEZI|nr:hypothetical protein F5144DRAFT_595587 [Chaetomium globosum]